MMKDSLVELDKSNNVAVVPVTIAIEPPDLAPIAFEAPSLINSSPNPALQLTWVSPTKGPVPRPAAALG
jgi:hypothetical protein